MIGAIAAGAVAGGAIVAHGTYHRNSLVFASPLAKLPESRTPCVALTFDDGPNPEATPRILDTLAELDVRATFFLLGKHAHRWPEIVRRIAREGHTIGNHGYHHRKLHVRGPRYITDDIELGTRAIADAAGVLPRLFRAPHGRLNPWVARAAKAAGQRLVGWTLGVWDTDLPGAGVITRRVLDGARARSIVLLHDGDGYDPAGDRSQTADAIDGIVRGLRFGGLELVTVPAP